MQSCDPRHQIRTTHDQSRAARTKQLDDGIGYTFASVSRSPFTFRGEPDEGKDNTIVQLRGASFYDSMGAVGAINMSESSPTFSERESVLRIFAYCDAAFTSVQFCVRCHNQGPLGGQA